MTPPLFELSAIVKTYGALRPLRIEHLAVAPSERIALLGVDATAAEVLVNLIVGATLPDAGDIQVFGRSTRAIADATDWLATADRFGIVSARAVLLESLSVIQNLAMPFTLEIEPPPEDVAARARALANDVGLSHQSLEKPVSSVGPTGHILVRLARALALDPAALLVEHPTAGIPRDEVAGLGQQMRVVCERRGVAAVIITGDEAYAHRVATRVLQLEPATGRLKTVRSGWLSRR